MKKSNFGFATLCAISALASAIGFAACGEETPTHTHIWSDEWSKSATHHWHACTVCDEIKDEAMHDFSNSTCVCGKQVSVGLELQLNKDGKSYYVKGISACTDIDIVIPPSYNGKPVTSIGFQAFDGCTSLTSIFIPKGVTSIDSYAFRGCTSLTSISIPSSVTSIGSQTFNGCASLTSIAIPNSVTSIGEQAFYHCASLTSITIPNSVTSIGYRAFTGCTSLTTIAIPSSVTSIGDYAFNGCSSLSSITISSIEPSIGSYAFHGTAYYENRTNWEDDLLYIGNHLISARTGLGAVTLKTNTNTIADSAFSRCTSLTSITLPNGISSIGRYAFEYCTSLTDITYLGERKYWSVVTKGFGWDSNTGKYTVHCTDDE